MVFRAAAAVLVVVALLEAGNMGRSLPRVIDAMVAEIPQEGFDDLRAELMSIRSSAEYSSPENARLSWTRTAEALEDGLGDPAGTPWKERIAGIFADQIKVGA